MRNLSERFARGAALALTGYNLYQNGRHLYETVQTKLDERAEARKFLLSISENEEDVYYPVYRWVLQDVPTQGKRSVSLMTYGDDLREVPPRHESKMYEITLDGTRYDVHIDPPAARQVSDGGYVMDMSDSYDRITFVCDTLEDRAKLIRKIDTLIVRINEAERPVYVFRSRAKGGWSTVKRLQERPMDTLFLPDGMIEDMTSDIERFMRSENKYIARGIPYHRGYLMYGPPGTGKSSTISAIASHFRKNVYFLSLSEIEGNSSLIQCVTDVPERAVLVLEDVDVVASTHTRNDIGGDHVTLDGLLNVLDGALTPEGLVTFMTTNHRENLDPALIRPGRADRQFELGYMTQGQLDRMVSAFVREGESVELKRNDVAPAEIVECLKSGFDNSPDYVIECIREVVS